MHSINEYIDQFLYDLDHHRGYSQATIQTYRQSLCEAFDTIEVEVNDNSLTFHLTPYRLKIAHLNTKTITKKLSAIRSFSEYLRDKGLDVKHTGDGVVKVAKTLPKPVAHTHIVEALQHASLMEKTVVVVVYTLGVRISELSNIKLEDISDGWVRVYGKGAKQRDIPLLQSTVELIKHYRQQFAPKFFLFEKDGKKLSENSLRYIIVKVFRRVGIKVTPHQLRHSYATALLNGGAPIVDVSELLGHASMASTQIYTKLGSALKQQNYEKAHPLCGVGQ